MKAWGPLLPRYSGEGREWMTDACFYPKQRCISTTVKTVTLLQRKSTSWKHSHNISSQWLCINCKASNTASTDKCLSSLQESWICAYQQLYNCVFMLISKCAFLCVSLTMPVACNCDPEGTLHNGVCESHTDPALGTVAGRCPCKENVEGVRCDKCRENYYGLSSSDPLGCRRM